MGPRSKNTHQQVRVDSKQSSKKDRRRGRNQQEDKKEDCQNGTTKEHPNENIARDYDEHCRYKMNRPRLPLLQEEDTRGNDWNS